MTKKDFLKDFTYVDFLNIYEDYYLFMSIFNDCFHLAAIAIKELCNYPKNPYYIKNTLQFNRIWNLLDQINYILDMDNNNLNEWIKLNRETYKKECEEKEVSISSAEVRSISGVGDAKKHRLNRAKRKSKKRFFQPKLSLYEDF